MKFINLLTIMALCAILPMYSCGSDSNTETGSTDTTSTGTEATQAPMPAPGTSDATGAVNPQMDVATQPASPPATAKATAGGAQHYICPKNCKGSGGAAAGTCPVCGSAYVHNQAFHAAGGNATPPPSPTSTANPAATTPTPTPAPSPAQNAAGVYHYTCAKGCAGGAASAGKCAKCGGDLAHNAAYHQ